jgi:hypothetical protein
MAVLAVVGAGFRTITKRGVKLVARLKKIAER